MGASKIEQNREAPGSALSLDFERYLKKIQNTKVFVIHLGS